MKVAKRVGIFTYSERAKLPIDIHVSHSYFPVTWATKSVISIIPTSAPVLSIPKIPASAHDPPTKGQGQ